MKPKRNWQKRFADQINGVYPKARTMEEDAERTLLLQKPLQHKMD